MRDGRIATMAGWAMIACIVAAINLAWQRESPAQEFATDIYIRGLYVSDDGDGPWTYFGAGDIGGGGGSLSGSTGSTDNAVLRANGTGGTSVQTSPMRIDDSGNATGLLNLDLAGELTMEVPLQPLYGGLGFDSSGVAANRFLYTASGGIWTHGPVTAQGRAILAASTASAQRTAMGLGTIATQSTEQIDVVDLNVTGDSRIYSPLGVYDALDDAFGHIGFDGTGEVFEFNSTGTEVLTFTGSTGSLDVPGALTLGTALAVAEGGTGAGTAGDARTNLGLAIGTNVQAYDAELQALAGTTSAADKVAYYTGSGTASTADLPAFGRTLIANASAGDARSDLGLGSIATQEASSVDITGGAIDGTVVGGTTPAVGTFTAADANSMRLSPLGEPFAGPASFTVGTPTSPGGYDFTGYGLSGGDVGTVRYTIWAYKTISATTYVSYSSATDDLTVDATLGATTFSVPVTWASVAGVDGFIVQRTAHDEFTGDSDIAEFNLRIVANGASTGFTDDDSGWIDQEFNYSAVAAADVTFAGTAGSIGTLAGVTTNLAVGSTDGTIAVTSQIPSITTDPGTVTGYFQDLFVGNDGDGELTIESTSQRGDEGAIILRNTTTSIGTPDPFNGPRLPIIANFENTSGDPFRGGRITFSAGDTTPGSEHGGITFHATNIVDISGTDTAVESIYLTFGNGDWSLKSDITNPDYAPAGTNQYRWHFRTSSLATASFFGAAPDIGGSSGSPKLMTAWTSNPTTDARIVIVNGTGLASGVEESSSSISDTAYDATSWNANSDVATKNAVRDKFESVVASIPDLASPGAIGGTTPGAGTFTTLTANDPATVVETRWVDLLAGASAGICSDPATVLTTTGALEIVSGQSTFFVPFPSNLAGCVLTRVRIKQQVDNAADNVVLTVVKRDESATGTSFTTIGAAQTYTGDTTPTVQPYDVPDETLAANTSYSIKVDMDGGNSWARVYSVGFEFSTLKY